MPSCWTELGQQACARLWRVTWTVHDANAGGMSLSGSAAAVGHEVAGRVSCCALNILAISHRSQVGQLDFVEDQNAD